MLVYRLFIRSWQAFRPQLRPQSDYIPTLISINTPKWIKLDTECWLWKKQNRLILIRIWGKKRVFAFEKVESVVCLLRFCLFTFFMVVTPLHYLQICLATLWMKKSCVFPAVKMTSMYWSGLWVHVHINKRRLFEPFQFGRAFQSPFKDPRSTLSPSTGQMWSLNGFLNINSEPLLICYSYETLIQWEGCR